MEGSREAAPSDIENQYNELEASMMEELDSLIPLSPSRCIYRVPGRIRRVREEAYTPRVTSIGPLHHGKKELKAMEEHKKRYLQYFLGRTNNLSLKDCIGKIKDQEVKLRSCYSETIEFTSDKFVGIILLDAIFLIELLFRNWKAAQPAQHRPPWLEEDCIFGKPKMINDVWPDLMMLENQLPLFILDELYDPYVFEGISINSLCRHFLHERIRHNVGGVSDDWERMPSEGEVLHLLDLLRKLYIKHTTSKPKAGGESDNRQTIHASEGKVLRLLDRLRKCIAPTLSKLEAGGESPPQYTTVPSIEALHMAGVKFEVVSNKNTFDIQFHHGILCIPKVIVYDETEVLLRNLVAFEQCIGNECYISNYVTIMDELVHTPEDAKLLAHYKIVDNNLAGGPSDLCTMINSISTGVCSDSEELYSDLYKGLNEFCDSLWHKRLANLRHKYFNTPWATISFGAAVILLLLTVIQTICSIISAS